jgi:hypothetical protein
LAFLLPGTPPYMAYADIIERLPEDWVVIGGKAGSP